MSGLIRKIGNTPVKGAAYEAFRKVADHLVAYGNVWWGKDYEEPGGGKYRVECDYEDADVISSKLKKQLGYTDVKGYERHMVILDIDHPVHLIESTTPGHYHLILETGTVDRAAQWAHYKELLELLSTMRILEPGYVSASIERGHADIRPPHRSKGDEKEMAARAEQLAILEEMDKARAENDEAPFRFRVLLADDDLPPF